MLETIAQQHDLPLLALAGAICGIASLATLNLLSRANAAARHPMIVWLGAASVFGIGIWAVHLIAMMAFQPRMPIAYDVSWTLASLGAAIVGAVAAFGIYVSLQDRRAECLFAGALLGLSVGAVHYLGIAAMRPTGIVALSTPRILLSLLAGAVFGALTLRRASAARSQLRRVEAAAYLTIAIAGIYVIGMPALAMAPGPMPPVDSAVLGSGSLAVAIGAVTIAVLGIILAGEVMDQHLSHRIRQASETLLQLAGSAFEGILIHRDGVIIEADEALCRLGGWDRQAIIGKDFSSIVAAPDLDRALEHMRVPTGAVPSEPIALQSATGRRISVEIVARTLEYGGEPAGVVGVRDLSARIRTEERIRHLAHHDALTGLPNRFLLHDRLNQAVGLSRRSDVGLAVFHLGLDRFKPVNDLLGHEAGDALLIEAAHRLQGTVRSTDTLARLGGDEFVIVQPLLQDPQAAATLARRVIQELSAPFMILGQRIEVGVSMGIALHPGDGETGGDLLRHADMAMYRAKQEGGGAFLFFERGMDEQLQERRLLEHDLRHAVLNGELELHYQPLFECSEKRLIGFEALLRWNHPRLGMVPPADFIPVAEECGLIAGIGRWVLERACSEAARWEKPYRIAVNLSPAQFKQTDLPSIVAEILVRTGLPACRLELEVTEGLLIGSTERAHELLTALKNLGVHISLDDFGTGYSSLSYLRRFPFDKIKIDKAFVNGLGQDEESAAIVRAIVALGRSLRLAVIAEGVETREQLDALRQLDCNEVQGFLLGRPVPVSKLPAFLKPQELVLAD